MAPSPVLLLTACFLNGSSPDGTLLTGTMVDDVGAEAAFTAHLGPGNAFALHYDYGALSQTMVSDGTDARQTNFSGQIEPIAADERADLEGLVAALREGPPEGEAWEWDLGHDHQTYTFTEVRPLRSRDTPLSLKERPVARPPAEPATSVPLTVLPTGHLAAPVQIGGVELTFLVDSGAGATVIDRGRAEQLGLAGVMPLKAMGLGGAETTRLTAPTELAVGDAALSLSMAMLDLSPIAGALGQPLDGVLGKETFHAYPVGFDRTHGQLTLYDRARFEAPAGYVEVPLTAGASGRWRAPATVEDQPEALVDLDTGSNGTLLVYQTWATAAGIPGERSVSSSLIGGVGGTRVVTRLHIASLTFAGHTWEGVPAVLAREDLGLGDDDASMIGNLGNGILNRYDLVLDAAASTLWARARDDVADFTTSRSGLQFNPSAEGWRVIHVAPEWDGAEGWASGDVVTHVDGEPVTPGRLMGADAWDVQPAGTRVTFRMADGTERRVTLTDWW